MNKKEQVIQLCKDLQTAKYSKNGSRRNGIYKYYTSIDILFQVLVQEKNDRFVRPKQNRIRAEISHRKSY